MGLELDLCRPIVGSVSLTSLVPSSETYKMVADKSLLMKEVDKRASLPLISLQKNNFKDKINPVIERAIRESISNSKKTLIFLNRKGFSTYIYCNKCKLVLSCSRCSSPLRYEYSAKELVCPFCSYKTEAVEICPQCQSSYVKYKGFGIEKLESTMQRVFPQARIFLLDEIIKRDLKADDYDIVLSTQSIFKMRDFSPDETIIWNLDAMLNINNYRSCENIFIVLYKLIAMTKQKVTICTGLDENFYLLKSLKSSNFKEFFRSEFKTRRELKLPPFFYNALISIRSTNKKSSEKTSLKVYDILKKEKSSNIEFSDPFSTYRYRLRSKYYKYILLKAKDISVLSAKIKHVLKKIHSRNVITTVNINPL